LSRVLVTGAGGFIGAHVVEHFAANTDWEIVATDSFRHKGKTDRLFPLWRDNPGRIEVVRHDLCVPLSAQMVDQIGDVDYVLALASESHVERSITDPVPFVRNNVDVVLSTLEYVRQAKPKSVIWTSTDEVYGPVEYDDMAGHPEWDTILPSNPYSASKAAQEAIAISYWRTYGIPLIIVNCMNLIGERQDSEKFLPSLIAGINEGSKVTIHGTPSNIGSRHYLHARNLADAMLFLTQFGQPTRYAGNICRPDRYNVVGPDRVTNLALAQMVAKIIGKPLNYELVDFHGARPGHDAHYGLDGTKLTELGWTLPLTLQESLEKTVNWTLKHPEWLQ
jgi:dTDP-glucose 4,6-dehydratase